MSSSVRGSVSSSSSDTVSESVGSLSPTETVYTTMDYIDDLVVPPTLPVRHGERRGLPRRLAAGVRRQGRRFVDFRRRWPTIEGKPLFSVFLSEERVSEFTA